MNDAFLEKMVIPRSFSSGLESRIVTSPSLKRWAPRLLEEGVHEGGLPVVDVGDDGDVPDVFAPFLIDHVWFRSTHYRGDCAAIPADALWSRKQKK